MRAPVGKVPRDHGAASRRGVGLPGLLALALVCVPAGASAQDTAPQALAAAEAAEREVDPARAERLYRRVPEIAPGSREARRARMRLEWLAARRDPREGYGPLAALERARRGPLDRRAAERFATTVDDMPPGLVRSEALFLLGETWLRRLDAPERAIPCYERLLGSEQTPPELRQVGEVALAEARAAAGQGARAIRGLEEAGLTNTFEGRGLRLRLERARIRAGALGLFGLALAVLLGAGRPWQSGRSGARRALAPRRVFLLLYVCAVPAAIAELYEPGTAGTFLAFGGAIVPVLALASLSAESLSARRAGRVARALSIASALLAPFAVAYLVLEQAGGLASFGL